MSPASQSAWICCDLQVRVLERRRRRDGRARELRHDRLRLGDAALEAGAVLRREQRDAVRAVREHVLDRHVVRGIVVRVEGELVLDALLERERAAVLQRAGESARRRLRRRGCPLVPRSRPGPSPGETIVPMSMADAIAAVARRGVTRMDLPPLSPWGGEAHGPRREYREPEGSVSTFPEWIAGRGPDRENRRSDIGRRSA